MESVLHKKHLSCKANCCCWMMLTQKKNNMKWKGILWMTIWPGKEQIQSGGNWWITINRWRRLIEVSWLGPFGQFSPVKSTPTCHIQLSLTKKRATKTSLSSHSVLQLKLLKAKLFPQLSSLWVRKSPWTLNVSENHISRKI